MSGTATGTQYTHLELEEKCRLRGLMEMEFGIGEIARRLRRHRATICREVGRNRCIDGAVSMATGRTAPGAGAQDQNG